MATYSVQSPPHAGASFALAAPGGVTGDLAPTGSNIALLVVNGATPTTVTLVPTPFDSLVVGTRTVTVPASQATLIPLPASVYGIGTTAVGYGNVTTLAGGATGVAVVTVAGSMSVLAYHPDTGHLASLTEEQLAHMRISGWMLKTEYDEQQAAQAKAQAAADATAQTAKTAPSGKDK